MVRVVQVIITRDGESRWSDSGSLLIHRDFASEALSEAGVTLEWVGPVKREDGALFAFSGVDVLPALLLAVKLEAFYKAKVIFYVDRLDSGIGGYSGVKEIVIGRGAPWATAHELGHQMGLHHVWDDTTDGVASENSSDCENAVTHCNVMSYCAKQLFPECRGQRISLPQKDKIRKRLTSWRGSGIVRWE